MYMLNALHARRCSAAPRTHVRITLDGGAKCPSQLPNRADLVDGDGRIESHRREKRQRISNRSVILGYIDGKSAIVI
jgi:hypothetical protein